MKSYTPQEVADRLGLSIFTIRRYIRAGQIRAEGGDGQIRSEEIQRFMQDRELPAFPPAGAAAKGLGKPQSRLE